jgi:hypothetical protein
MESWAITVIATLAGAFGSFLRSAVKRSTRGADSECG